jgi:hypothetical protein
MAPVYMKPWATNLKAARIQSHVSSFTPPVAFAWSRQASTKHEATDFQEFKRRFTSSDKKSQKTKKSKDLLNFDDGNAEIWCEWQEQLYELFLLVPLTTAKQRGKAVVPLLCGNALALYATHQSRKDCMRKSCDLCSRWLVRLKLFIVKFDHL